MGEALDSTRHYMPVEDVIIPDEGKDILFHIPVDPTKSEHFSIITKN